jgi:hypothetical protein
LSQCRIEFSAGNRHETESRKEITRRGREQIDVANAALARQL